MLTVTKHLPPSAFHARDCNNMTPDEVTAEWRERMRRRRAGSLRAIFWIIAGALTLATIGFFTH